MLDALDWSAELDIAEREHDAALAEDDAYNPGAGAEPDRLGEALPYRASATKATPAANVADETRGRTAGSIPATGANSAMKDALALVAAGGRASRYAYQCAGGIDPHLHRRIFRWAMQRLTGGK